MNHNVSGHLLQVVGWEFVKMALALLPYIKKAAGLIPSERGKSTHYRFSLGLASSLPTAQRHECKDCWSEAQSYSFS